MTYITLNERGKGSREARRHRGLHSLQIFRRKDKWIAVHFSSGIVPDILRIPELLVLKNLFPAITSGKNGNVRAERAQNIKMEWIPIILIFRQDLLDHQDYFCFSFQREEYYGVD
jgi:hypothetical protein